MESCDFVNEEFPAEIQKFAKEQQVLVYAKYSSFLYKVLGTAVFFSIFGVFRILFFPFKKRKFRNCIIHVLQNSANLLNSEFE